MFETMVYIWILVALVVGWFVWVVRKCNREIEAEAERWANRIGKAVNEGLLTAFHGKPMKCHYCKRRCHPRNGARIKQCVVTRSGRDWKPAPFRPVCASCIYDYDLAEEMEQDWREWQEAKI